jgi:hypothetical protein
MRVTGILIALAILMAACAGRSRTGAGEEKKISAPPVEVRVGESVFEPLPEGFTKRYQPDVRLAARWENDRLSVALSNQTTRTLTVSAANLGVLVNGQLIRITPENAVAQFPASVLAPGEGATGAVRFRESLGDLKGQRCVFHHPLARPSLCIIRGPAPKPIPAPPGPSSQSPR